MSNDRRAHRRLPLTLSVAQPIKIEITARDKQETVPGIIVNISAGGMAMIMFSRLPEEAAIEFTLDFMGISEPMKGEIVRQEEKFDNTFLVGIKYDRSVEKLADLIDNMAEDFDICELRYLIKNDDACFPKCSFRALCAKRIKKEFQE